MDTADAPTICPPPRPHHDVLSELHSLRQSQSSQMEATLPLARRQSDDCVSEITNLSNIIEGLCDERDQLSSRVGLLEKSLMDKDDEFARKFEEEMREREALTVELQVYMGKFESFEREREARAGFLSKTMESMRISKEGLIRVLHIVDDDRSHEGGETGNVDELGIDSELVPFWHEIMDVRKLVDVAESKLSHYAELRKKEKKQLESSVVSLTEENRDISSLLRVALVEKEAVEKNLNKLKGNNDQKRVPLLHRVGFGFMMGSMEQPTVESSGASSTGSKSDGSECEEEVVSLASSVEKIMKNLRQEISQLRRSLDEARSDNERLQSLTNKQAQEISENALYIKELEERERLLAQNMEDLLFEIKETESEVARWREACELEVEAGKNEVEERDKVVSILQQELEKTKSALEISNGKLKLKEELAAAAMAAQTAAEKCVELADRRAGGLRERIEELRRQVEEADGRERSRRIREFCWPWRGLKVNPANNALVRRMVPEMQSLLQYR